MELSLAQAKLASPHCRPNPAVGAVIVGADGAILGVGHTQPVGQDHAEIAALRNAKSLGHDVAGATMYVTLEPCAHYGRTGPCALALIDAKLFRVVASVEDPNPEVGGKGFQMLRDAGIELDIGAGSQQSRDLNKGFFSRLVRGIPWVRLKVASSMDGRTALVNGESQWITGSLARENGHTWRAKASTILTGIGTVLKDDPRLDTHGEATSNEPTLAIVDSQLKTPLNAKLFEVSNRQVLIFTACEDISKRNALEAQGAEIIRMPVSQLPNSKVDLVKVLTELARREIGELHVEAGAILNGALIQQGLVDEIIWYVAPRLLGPGASIANIGALNTIAESARFRFLSSEIIGDDLCIIARNIKSEII